MQGTFAFADSEQLCSLERSVRPQFLISEPKPQCSKQQVTQWQQEVQVGPQELGDYQGDESCHEQR